MTGAQQIVEAIDQLERLYAELAEVATRTDDRRRHDLIDLRRQLSTQIACVGKVGEPAFAAKGDPALARVFREKLSAMRSATATHQANWPAMRLGEDRAAHDASVRTVREANLDFIDWVRATVAPAPPLP